MPDALGTWGRAGAPPADGALSATSALLFLRSSAPTPPGLHLKSQPRFRPAADDGRVRATDAGGMNETEAPQAGMAIRVEGVTKRFGEVTAVEDLSFCVRSGSVTGFLGPNGAGKSTALKVIAGLIRPTAGRAVINGVPVESSAPNPAVLGAHIESCGAHPGRTGRDHLRSLAALAGIERGRVDEMLSLVGLERAARRRAGKYSSGMRQRLGLASALLGDPEVLVLDEPLNGLDPQGIRWLRTLLRQRARDGRTVLLSSHVLTETAQTVDDVIVIHRGRLVGQGPIDELSPAGASLEDVFFSLTEEEPS